MLAEKVTPHKSCSLVAGGPDCQPASAEGTLGRPGSASMRHKTGLDLMNRKGNQTRRRFVYLVAAALVCISPCTLRAQNATPGKTIRVLFIGNSYTYYNDLPQTLQSMAQAASKPVKIELGTELEGGATLQRHWSERTLELIRSGRWDYVVLQEQSLAPIESTEQFIEYGKRFVAEIRAAKAQPVLYLTWARQRRPETQEQLNQAYQRLARETQALLVPVGPAWQEYQRLDRAAQLYDDDGSHPTPLGSFLAASMFYRTLFGMQAPARFTPSRVSPTVVPVVQRAVEAAVRGFPRQTSEL